MNQPFRALRPALCGVVLFSLSLSVPAVAAEHPAMSKMRTAVKQIQQNVSTLQAQQQEDAVDAEALQAVVDEVVAPNFDFAVISRLVLGKHWKQISADQRSAFVEQFRLLLVRSYSRSLLKSPDVKIDYLDVEVSKKRSDLVLVKTRMALSETSSFLVDYRMLGGGEDWKVVDIVVDGVSLLSTYRGSFGTEIEKNGMDALLTQLRDKNSGAGDGSI